MDDESRLIRAMAGRDRDAWSAIHDRLVGDVFGVAYHLAGGDRPVAEDLNQQAWPVAIERFDRFDPARGRFRDWLLGIARHLALRHLRRAPPEGLGDRDLGPSDALPPLEWPEGVERADLVRAALLLLEPDRRRVLPDRHAEGLSVGAIAARTGRAAKAVESLLARARGQLRALLGPQFSIHHEGGRREPTDARTP